MIPTLDILRPGVFCQGHLKQGPLERTRAFVYRLVESPEHCCTYCSSKIAFATYSRARQQYTHHLNLIRQCPQYRNDIFWPTMAALVHVDGALARGHRSAVSCLRNP